MVSRSRWTLMNSESERKPISSVKMVHTPCEEDPSMSAMPTLPNRTMRMTITTMATTMETQSNRIARSMKRFSLLKLPISSRPRTKEKKRECFESSFLSTSTDQTRRWRNKEGERLADFGLDEDAEFYDEDNLPLSEIMRRRKADQ